jgi:hypothetical protein
MGNTKENPVLTGTDDEHTRKVQSSKRKFPLGSDGGNTEQIDALFQSEAAYQER